MKDQHEKIKGYRNLTQSEIDMMNEAKELGEKLKSLINNLRDLDSIDQRWLSEGQTDLQKGIMSVVRSIAKPESF